jgi:hypothetical protein
MSPDAIYLAHPAAASAVIDPTEGRTCPECAARGIGGAARIGNRRSDCGTCNRYGAAVRRAAMTLLRAKHPRAYDRALAQARASVYATMVAAAIQAGEIPPGSTALAPLPALPERT